ncbi:MAG: hypF [Clostridiaceae bacterium]|jgi:hydrogenase maturation protein HypF|nr:hypF [Clostridiaceae bacterium]
MLHLFIKVEGIVQGVGFRPFVYNLAYNNSLTGWVNNNSEGVYINIEGLENNINSFINILKNNPPPLSKIENIIIKELPLENFNTFSIRESETKKNKITLISPDIATCSDCLKDIHNKYNRRFRYAFTNCTNCGPRFSIIKNIPYDRCETTMGKFKMCNECESEYTNPLNRRFHAQPNACENCGPHLWITDSSGNIIEMTENNIIDWTIEKLKKGDIFAVKGLGGFLLVCDGHNDKAIKKLRKRKRRPDKPFAVMMRNIDTIDKYCQINQKEFEVLTGIRKPIVLLNKKNEFKLPNSIAPNMTTLGVMLPYTPLHELLLSGDLDTLIMTSANIYGCPIEYENNSALEKLHNIVDFFLFHNRDIYTPIDDSVVRYMAGEIRMIRRARGYVPDPVNYSSIENILAVGPDMKNTFSIGLENYIFLSQHNGDLQNVETIYNYKRNIDHLKDLFSFIPKFIAYDAHPNYESTLYAMDINLKRIPVYHHHAHIASCMVENKLIENVIGLSFDGTGFGTDDCIWGSEFLICNKKSFQRIGHLDYTFLSGGDKSIKEPWRSGVSYLLSTGENLNKKNQYRSLIESIFGSDGLKLYPLIDNKINCVKTSSMGRFFDAAASILGIRKLISYEGQASIELECKIPENYSYSSKVEHYYQFDIVSTSEEFIIMPYKIIDGIITDLNKDISIGNISWKFHNSIINFSLKLCQKIRTQYLINDIVLSGGVFQNIYLMENIVNELEKLNFKVYTHKCFPSNDGGISLGQIAIASEKIKDEEK